MDNTTADDGGIGDALSMLGDSMDELSTDLTGLGSAVAKLEASTRSLSEQQRKVSREMSATVDSLRDEQASRTARTTDASFSAAADD
ncbi:hypothetical protein [Salinibaculum rarum]|uniref:hypothetical protein n=1 Tax=Salinibaculum rarum TaxID=3058903 RepID=UPI00265F7B6D|nr:hypothetical protein [Salinibaculum sp. KK48]